MRHGLSKIQMSQISEFSGLEHGIESPLKRGKPCKKKEMSELWLGMVRIIKDKKYFTLQISIHLLKEV